MRLPILDPKKVPADWETDVFGLVYPARAHVRVVPYEQATVWSWPPMAPEDEQALLGKWQLEVRGRAMDNCPITGLPRTECALCLMRDAMERLRETGERVAWATLEFRDHEP